MKEQKKRILKVSFGFLLVVTFLVVSQELFESYLKSLFFGNKIVTLIVLVPFALYFFKKIEHYIDKNANESSNSKELLKGLKDYGQKKWYNGRCYSCKTNSLTALVEENLPIGKKLTCTKCGGVNKKTIPQRITLIPLSIYGIFEIFDIYDEYKLKILLGSIGITIILSVILGYFWVNKEWVDD
tara:strand:+ start:834 stop:1385 length:552 start_codon:yes stop_codon:yes gene_type:complete